MPFLFMVGRVPVAVSCVPIAIAAWPLLPHFTQRLLLPHFTQRLLAQSNWNAHLSSGGTFTISHHVPGSVAPCKRAWPRLCSLLRLLLQLAHEKQPLGPPPPWIWVAAKLEHLRLWHTKPGRIGTPQDDAITVMIPSSDRRNCSSALSIAQHVWLQHAQSRQET